MNFSVIDITPLPLYLSPTTKRPPNTKEFNYKSILIEDDGKYHYWSKGVSLNISRQEYEQVRSNPKLYYSSITHQLNERINLILRKNSDE
jgi:hypothetical protein